MAVAPLCRFERRSETAATAWPRWGISSSYRLRSGTWKAGRVARKAGAAARLSSYDVVPADPDSLAVDPSPVSRPPDVIGPPDVIPRAASIVRPIANLDRDGAWVSCIPWTVTGSVRATAVIATAVIRIGASACANHDNNEQEPENRPLSSHYGLGVTGSCLRFPMINSLGFHTFVIRIRPNFCALPLC
jgi:hypothetical protein